MIGSCNTGNFKRLIISLDMAPPVINDDMATIVLAALTGAFTEHDLSAICIGLKTTLKRNWVSQRSM